MDSAERESLLGRAVLIVAGVKFETKKPTSDMINTIVNHYGSDIYSLSDYTLSLLCDPKLKQHWKTTAARGLIAHWSNQMISDFLLNASLLQGKTNDIQGGGFDTITRYLQILQHYKELAPVGADYAYQRARQTSAIIRFTKLVVANAGDEVRRTMILDIKGDLRGHSLPYVNDTNLRNMLLSPEYDVEAVLEIVTQRNIFEAEHLLALLDTPSRTLAEGVL